MFYCCCCIPSVGGFCGVLLDRCVVVDSIDCITLLAVAVLFFCYVAARDGGGGSKQCTR